MEKVRHSAAVSLWSTSAPEVLAPAFFLLISFKPVIGSPFAAHQFDDGWQRYRIAHKIIISDETKLYTQLTGAEQSSLCVCAYVRMCLCATAKGRGLNAVRIISKISRMNKQKYKYSRASIH